MPSDFSIISIQHLFKIILDQEKNGFIFGIPKELFYNPNDNTHLKSTIYNQDIDSRFLYVQADISKNTDRNILIRKVEEKFGRIDVLVNNAGVAPIVRNDILDTTEESFDRVMSINLKGPYFLTQSISKWMIKLKENLRDSYQP